MVEFLAGVFFGVVGVLLAAHYLETRRCEREAREYRAQAARFTLAPTDPSGEQQATEFRWTLRTKWRQE